MGGKSTVLNAIIGHKRLSVSRTAGHTKHIQHIPIVMHSSPKVSSRDGNAKCEADDHSSEDDSGPPGPSLVIMDCPGLVFPQRVPRHVLEVSGLLPVAQIRETMSALRVLAMFLPLETICNLKFPDYYD